MTQTYPTISSTKIHRPSKPKKPAEKKIKSESKFCPKSKGKCNCSSKKK